MATDMVKPPGVIMWRNGEMLRTSRRAASKARSDGLANPPNKTAPGPSTRSRAGRSANSSCGAGSCGIVENDPKSMTMTRSQLADAVAQIHAIVATRTLNRAIINREHHRVALVQRHD